MIKVGKNASTEKLKGQTQLYLTGGQNADLSSKTEPTQDSPSNKQLINQFM